MSFIDCFFIAVYIIAAFLALAAGIWRLACHFKKTCGWKSCPYRHHYHLCRPFGWLEIGCRKFPPTQEELNEEEKQFEQMETLIGQLKEQNKTPDTAKKHNSKIFVI